MGQDSVICIGICGEDGDRLLRMLDAIGAEVISVRYPSGNTRTNIICLALKQCAYLSNMVCSTI